MIAPLLLVAYALLAATVGAWRLMRATWPGRAPAIGMAAWQALCVSIVAAAVLAGATLAVPRLPLGAQLETLVDACWLAVRQQYSTPGGAAGTTLGLVLIVGVMARLLVSFGRDSILLARRRRQLRRQLRLAAHRDGVAGALVLPHPASAVYCLPGWHGAVVVCTSAALDTLTGPELRAVLAHERAHLVGRHDLVILLAGALRAAFPFVPAFRLGHAELTRLVEMRADDVAARRHPRRVLAAALVRLAEAAVPAAALSAGGGTALARVHRLLRPCRPLRRAAAAVAVAGVVAVSVVPLLMALAPAVVVAVLGYCPPGFPPSL